MRLPLILALGRERSIKAFDDDDESRLIRCPKIALPQEGRESFAHYLVAISIHTVSVSSTGRSLLVEVCSNIHFHSKEDPPHSILFGFLEVKI